MRAQDYLRLGYAVGRLADAFPFRVFVVATAGEIAPFLNRDADERGSPSPSAEA